MLATLMILQGVVGPPAPRILHRTQPVTIPCPEAASGGEIVVCGRPGDQRLPRLPEPTRRPPEASLTYRLPGGGTGNVHAIQSTLPGGTGSGAVLSVKLPFGKSSARASE